MFQIAARPKSEGAAVVALVGKMTVTSVGEVRRSIDKARQQSKRVILDLSELTLVDKHSVEFLAAQSGDSVTLKGCPPYLERWLALEQV